MSWSPPHGCAICKLQVRPHAGSAFALISEEGMVLGGLEEGVGGGGGGLPVPGVCVIPPGEVVLEHVDAQQLVEFLLVPVLHILLLQLPLPGIHKSCHVPAVPQHHQAWQQVQAMSGTNGFGG